METLKQIGLCLGGTAVAIVLLHIFIIGWMVMAIMINPDQVQHIPYWDNLLRAVIQILN